MRRYHATAESDGLSGIRQELARQTAYLDSVHSRLATLESLTARQHAELILGSLRSTVGDSRIRAKIVELTSKRIGRSTLLATLGISSQHLSNELRQLVNDDRFVIAEKSERELEYSWAPMLRHLGVRAVLKAIEEDQIK